MIRVGEPLMNEMPSALPVVAGAIPAPGWLAGHWCITRAPGNVSSYTSKPATALLRARRAPGHGSVDEPG